MTKKLPIDMIEPDERAPAKTCPPCHGDCDQSDTCPARLQSTSDFDAPLLRSVLLALAVFWAAMAFLMLTLATA